MSVVMMAFNGMTAFLLLVIMTFEIVSPYDYERYAAATMLLMTAACIMLVVRFMPDIGLERPRSHLIVNPITGWYAVHFIGTLV